MKKLALFALVTSVAVLPALTGAVAQTKSDTDRATGATSGTSQMPGATQDHTKGAVQGEAGHTTGAAQDHTRSAVQRRAGHVGTEGMIPSNELIGAKVESSDGKDIGKVDRLLVDSNTGRIHQVVIRTGGFAGIKAKHVVVPWSEVKSGMQQDRNRVVIRMDKATLDQAPAWEPRQARREGAPAASPSTERGQRSGSTSGSGTSR